MLCLVWREENLLLVLSNKIEAPIPFNVPQSYYLNSFLFLKIPANSTYLFKFSFKPLKLEYVSKEASKFRLPPIIIGALLF